MHGVFLQTSITLRSCVKEVLLWDQDLGGGRGGNAGTAAAPPGTTKPWAVGRCWWEQRLRGSVTSEAAVSERMDKEARYSRSEEVD